MKDLSIENSPQVYARVGGALYLIIIALGIFAEAFVRNRIIVANDPAATAANLTAMESLWRTGIAAEFFALICTITLAMIYFFLLRPVSKELNLLAIVLQVGLNRRPGNRRHQSRHGVVSARECCRP